MNRGTLATGQSRFVWCVLTLALATGRSPAAAHLGQLIAYARSKGVTPPWSK